MSEQKIGIQRSRLPFTMLENSVFLDRELTKNDLMVYWSLCFHADREGKCYPSLSLLCKEARISRGSIMACLKHLMARDFLVVASRLDPAGDRDSNLYTIKGRMGVVQSGNDVVQTGNDGSSIPLQELDSINKIRRRRAGQAISFDFDTGVFHGIDDSMIGEWENAYPDVDIDLSLAQMSTWLKANPDRLKKNYARFIVNWLGREQKKRVPA